MNKHAGWVWSLAVIFFFTGCANEPPPPAVSKPVAVTPAAQQMITFSDNTFIVGGGEVVKGGHYIPPATYSTDGVTTNRMAMGKCLWSMWRADGGFGGAGWVEGPTEVAVSTGQRFEVRGGCKWSAVVPA